jgi:hypothetical protein
MNYRGAWQQALSVLGRNTSRTAPVRNQSPALYRDLAGSCSKILPSAQAGLSGQMPAQTLSVMSVTGLQSGVGSPVTTGPKRSVPFLRLARPKSPHQNRKAVRPTATLPHCLKRILTISLALNLILRPLSDQALRELEALPARTWTCGWALKTRIAAMGALRGRDEVTAQA